MSQNEAEKVRTPERHWLGIGTASPAVGKVVLGGGGDPVGEAMAWIARLDETVGAQSADHGVSHD